METPSQGWNELNEESSMKGLPQTCGQGPGNRGGRWGAVGEDPTRNQQEWEAILILVQRGERTNKGV